MIYDFTERVAEARAYYDSLLDERIEKISKLSGVPREQMLKINPADFVEENKFVEINGYRFRKIADWINEHKTDDVFLISPLDAPVETANQISYKQNMQIEKTIRASKCDVVPVPKDVAQDFYIKNHRQTVPNFSGRSVCFGLVYKDELVSVMHYDITSGAIRGANTKYELVRLAIKHNYRIHGGASKLQKACEDTLRKIGETEIYSYSNATINNGAVYKALGFTGTEVIRGQPFVIMEDFSLMRLIELFPYSTQPLLAARGRMTTHIGGNKMWTKNIQADEKPAE